MADNSLYYMLLQYVCGLENYGFDYRYTHYTYLYI